MKTAELTGLWLDYWAAKAAGRKPQRFDSMGHAWVRCEDDLVPWSPSTLWAQGGPIIEREGIAVWLAGEGAWCATPRSRSGYSGLGSIDVEEYDDNLYSPTPLIAAMRAFVASKIGDEVPNS